MKIVRFARGKETGYGVYREGLISPLAGSPFSGAGEACGEIPSSEVRLLSPVMPSKVVAVGLNYRDHAREFGLEIPEQPILFIKASSTVTGPGAKVVYPRQSGRVDYEAELAVVIGAEAHEVSEEEASTVVFGYTCGLDMTARDLQMVDGQWTRAKNFDGFCPLGPWVETELAPDDLAIELRLNGELKQSSRTSQMIFGVPRLVSFISGVMTLYPGDVIMTGTPPGVGEVRPGDAIEACIEGIGVLACTMVGNGRQRG